MEISEVLAIGKSVEGRFGARLIQHILFTLATRDENKRERLVSWLDSATKLEAVTAVTLLHRVDLAVAQTLNEWVGPAKLPGFFKDWIAELHDLRRLYEAELSSISVYPGLQEGRFMIIKGLALQHWYAESITRYFKDIDVLVDDEMQFWQLGRWAIEHGYASSALGLAMPVGAGPDQWRFMFALEKDRAGAILHAKYELMQGFVPVTARGFLDLRPILRRASGVQSIRGSNDIKLARSPFVYPTREDCLLILLVEMFERDLIVRDAVDLHMLLGCFDGDAVQVDWGGLRRSIEQGGLTSQFLRLARYYSRVSRRRLPEQIDRTCRYWERRYPYWKLAIRYPALRFTTPALARRNGLARVLRDTLLNIGDKIVESPLPWNKPESAALSSQMAGRMRKLAYLLPISLQSCTPRQWRVGLRGELFLCSPIGSFLATSGSDFSEEFIEEMKSYPIERLRPL